MSPNLAWIGLIRRRLSSIIAKSPRAIAYPLLGSFGQLWRLTSTTYAVEVYGAAFVVGVNLLDPNVSLVDVLQCFLIKVDTRRP